MYSHQKGISIMKQSTKKLFSLFLLFTTATININANVAPFIQFRSEGRDTARKLVGTTSHHVYLDDMESFYGTFNATFQYDRSFRGKELTECLFGNSLITAPSTTSGTNSSCNASCDGGRSIAIQGFDVPAANNITNAWRATDFFLPLDFQSTISFKPLVQNFLVDFNLYVGLDEWVKGLYFRLYGPVVNNRMGLHADETVLAKGSGDVGTSAYPQGFVDPNAVTPTSSLFPNALSFFAGNSLPAPITGITFNPLQFAKINSCGNHSITGFAELRGEFGWNYLHEDYHAGFNVQAAAPTGKRPHGEFLFENQIGNGKHWELGIGLSGHYTMWRSEDEEKHFDFIIEGDITHLFGAKQHRTFDLIGKPDSRYMLAEQLVSNTNSTPHINNSIYEFGNVYSPVANFSTRNVKVSVGVQADIVAMLNYTAHGFSWDLGYNFWGVSKEDIDLSDSDSTTAFPENTWALKGLAQVAGVVTGTTTVVRVSETQSNATIQALPIVNSDSPVPATTTTGLAIVQPASSTTPGAPQITSAPPVFIKESDLNIEGAEIRSISNKVFTHFSYTWIDREDWVPYLGIGFQAEFGSHHPHNNNNNSNSCDDDSISCALSKWAILLKGGVSFD
jgi:hypothetical protein